MEKPVREGHLSIEEGNTMIVFDSSTLILLAKKDAKRRVVEWKA
jgi:hypothetical protein